MSSSPIQNSLTFDGNDRIGLRAPLQFEKILHGGLTWRIAGELVGPLLTAGGLDVERRLRDGSATVVKSGEHRTVYRLQLPCGRFYLKHYRTPDWKSRLQNCVRRSPAEREWRAIDLVAGTGISTIEPAAFGVRKRGPFTADSYLLTRAIEPAESLQDYIRRLADCRTGIPAARRQKLAVRLGTLFATLHTHGLIHGDLHAGNVLVRDEPNDEPRLWLIDLHAMRQRRWLSLRRVAKNLAMFAHFFMQYGTPADRMRFFQAYWNRVNSSPAAEFSREESKVEKSKVEREPDLRPSTFRPSTIPLRPASSPSRSISLPGADDPPSRRHIIHTIQTACEQWSARAFDKADRKWFRGHRKLVIVDTAAAHCRGVAELGADFLRLVGRHPDMLQSGLLTIAGDLQKTFDRPEHPSIRICIGPAGNPVSLFWLGRRQQWSAARVRWEMAHALLRRGIPTPRPLLFAEERCGPQRRTFLVTASPRRATRTLGASESLRRDGANPNAASTAILQAARVLRQLHDHGFLHTRLAESAFLVANRDVPESSEPGSQGFRSSELGGRRSANVVEFRRPAIIQRSKVRDRSSERASDSDLRPPTSDLRPLNDVLLIHVDAVRWVGEVSPQQAVAQLSSLSASISGGRFTPADRLRFLLAYLGPKCRGEWKSIWAETRDATGEPPLSDGLSRRRFLRAALAVAGLAVGCQVPKQSVLARPARHSIRSGRLVVYSDHKLPKHHPLIEDLILLRKQITVALDLPVQKEEVAIYIFSTEKEFRDYLNRAYPGLPNRRAFFMGSRDELAVYTYWGERIQEDLRHEYTHGLLHASLRAVPLWLDEGLAEYFEVAGPRPGTVNTEYAGRLAASVVNGWRPNLAALEKLEEFSRMQHIHYQEAWAWVHYMLHDTTGAKPVLLAYLNDLRTQTSPTPLSERLKRELPNAEERFLAHASTLQTPQLLPAGRLIPTAGTASTGPFPAK